MMHLVRDVGVLRVGAVRRLVGAVSSSMAGDLMVVTAMPFAVISMGGSATQIAWTLAIQGIGVAVALPIGGVVGDRFPRKVVMVASDLARLASQTAIATLLLLGGATFEMLFVAQAIHGLATGVFMPASTAIVPDVVDHELVQPTNGLKAAAESVAAAAGPVLGASAVALAGPGLAMAADAGTFLLSAVMLAGLPARRAEVGQPSSTWAQLREGWRAFRGHRWITSMTVEFTLINALVIAPFYVLGPVVAEASFGGADGWAVMLGALAIGQFIGGIRTMGWRPQRPLVAAALLFTLWSIPLALLGGQAPLALIALGTAAAGAGQAAFAVLWDTTLQNKVAPGQRSRLSSFDQLGSLSFVPLGFLLGGWVEETIGARAAFVGGAVFLLVSLAVVITLPWIRSVTLQPAALAATGSEA